LLRSASGHAVRFGQQVTEPVATHHPSARAVSRSDGYERRRPEETVLYQTIAAHWPAFRERLEQSGGLPKFVVSEFEEYLDCGQLEAGCLLLKCRRCSFSQLVAFSCYLERETMRSWVVFRLRKRSEVRDSTAQAELVWC
jgi:hypothetical protein